jgi:hypothetical protein
MSNTDGAFNRAGHSAMLKWYLGSALITAANESTGSLQHVYVEQTSQ